VSGWGAAFLKSSVPQHRRREPRTLDDHLPRAFWIGAGIVFSLAVWVGLYVLIFTSWGPFR
jgi:hypothetical protein